MKRSSEPRLHEPPRYYVNNFRNTIALLDAMVDTGVKRFVFSSSAAVYGTPATNPVTEAHGCAPINAYGKSKLLWSRRYLTSSKLMG